MKSIFVIALIATFAAVNVFAGLSPEQSMEYLTVCRKELSITDEEFNQLISAKTFDAVNENSKCFFNCFQEKEGTLIDGVIQEDKVIELFESSIGLKKAKEIYDICKMGVASEKCETGFNLQKCYRDNGIF